MEVINQLWPDHSSRDKHVVVVVVVCVADKGPLNHGSLFVPCAPLYLRLAIENNDPICIEIQLIDERREIIMSARGMLQMHFNL